MSPALVTYVFLNVLSFAFGVAERVAGVNFVFRSVFSFVCPAYYIAYYGASLLWALITWRVK